MPRSSVHDFHALLKPSTRILALCGAGLSASSGLPTFRGAGGLWRNYQSTSLATPEAFADDPALVWLFYAWRRHLALKASPNAAHHALAALDRAIPDRFLCLTQNVDGLSPRAGHTPPTLRTLHGSLLDVTCSSATCTYRDANNTKSPLCAALAPAAVDAGPLLDPSVPRPVIREKDLPHCPDCGSLLRPGVVWFGEALDEKTLDEADDWVEQGVDIVIVIGTSAQVIPAAEYVLKARNRGAVVVVINPDPDTGGKLRKTDFFFPVDAAELLPVLLAPLCT